MEKRYKVEQCKELKCWIAFEILSSNLSWDVYHARLKKECKEWVKKNKGKILRGGDNNGKQ